MWHAALLRCQPAMAAETSCVFLRVLCLPPWLFRVPRGPQYPLVHILCIWRGKREKERTTERERERNHRFRNCPPKFLGLRETNQYEAERTRGTLTALGADIGLPPVPHRL
ncbi:hypothetical protein B0T19DRAFT_124698 [Cercophora scortea]|uniref:Uncharacterized protein n=1 Tax=Cercophora scortea TaxID=314031 RepID=A0AAE0MI17_9PEZI|nr:hypothetical protein B0T19DRAFT_124698 [Cercophora scortea]